MDFYLKNIATGDSLRIPLLPDELKIGGGDANSVTMNIISLGEVKIPRGVKVTSYSWEGIFPGSALSSSRAVKDWKAPLTIKRLLEQYRDAGTKLRFMATDVAINENVYIERLSGSFKGGLGDYRYSIVLQRWRNVNVQTVNEAGIETDTLSLMISAHFAAIRPASTTEKYYTHTVVAGDTLFSIAAKYLGSGNQQDAIYQLNKEMMDAANKGKQVSKYTVYIGQVLLVKLKPEPPAPEPPAAPARSTNNKKKTTKVIDVKHIAPAVTHVSQQMARTITKIRAYTK